MKKFLAVILTVLMAVSMLAGCGTKTPENTIAATELDANVEIDTADIIGAYLIGVPVYSVTDEQVISFKEYLEYIKGCFPAVDFIFSESITNADEEQEFLKEVLDQGAVGIMGFSGQDVKAAVELCESYGAYYITPSATLSDEVFDSIKNNPYYVGMIGPGRTVEYETGSDIAKHYYEKANGNSYVIYTGGAFMGNAMHLQRTVGVLETLAECAGVDFDKDATEIALSPEITHVNAGDLDICIVPGYLEIPTFNEAAKAELDQHEYNTAIAVMAAADIPEACYDHGVDFGIIDCYSDTNRDRFENGTISYVAGKYNSIIGPSFAALFNAITGHADEFRVNGEAFDIDNGFWCSDTKEDYNRKFALSAGVVINAYNHEDISAVSKLDNPNATFDDLKALAEAYTFEDACARRNWK